MQHPSLELFQLGVKKALEHLHLEFSKLQTGRANAGLIEHIPVQAYGQRMEMKGVASISVQDARSISIQPWDKAVLADIEKAILVANIGVNPVNDGVSVRLNFPSMTEERRMQIKKTAHQLAEGAKISVRQDRQKTNDIIKAITEEDEKERLVKELQKLVDEANENIEVSLQKKDQEIMTV
jgi:ribosome recycling factor